MAPKVLRLRTLSEKIIAGACWRTRTRKEQEKIIKMTEQLKIKVERAIRLIQSIPNEVPIEVAYSGGKDSDVILELAKMAGINFRAIYKNTTIDPPGTIRHCIDNGVEILRPKISFFELISKKGFPSRNARFCCERLKEYKVLDYCILGIRREESAKRKNRYTEPEYCRMYSKTDKTKNARHYIPIMDWGVNDIVEFAEVRGIRFHPLYYDKQGVFHPERRLGCMCCPLASRQHRINEFLSKPNMVKVYILAGEKYLLNHPNSHILTYVQDVYEWFVLHLFCDSKEDFKNKFGRNLFSPAINCKSFLEGFFNIRFD